MVGGCGFGLWVLVVGLGCGFERGCGL
jgi:hypothetical protein